MTLPIDKWKKSRLNLDFLFPRSFEHRKNALGELIKMIFKKGFKPWKPTSMQIFDSSAAVIYLKRGATKKKVASVKCWTTPLITAVYTRSFDIVIHNNRIIQKPIDAFINQFSLVERNSCKNRIQVGFAERKNF